MDPAEQGRQDALARKEASSLDPRYQLGYTDGVYERAQHSAAKFSDVTIDGIEISASRQPGSTDWSLSLIEGDKTTLVGHYATLDEAIEFAVMQLHKDGKSAVRPSAIDAHLAALNPNMPGDERQRLVQKAVDFIREHRREAGVEKLRFDQLQPGHKIDFDKHKGLDIREDGKNWPDPPMSGQATVVSVDAETGGSSGQTGRGIKRVTVVLDDGRTFTGVANSKVPVVS